MVSKEDYLKSLTKAERKRYAKIAILVAEEKKKRKILEEHLKMVESMLKIQGKHQKKNGLKRFVKEQDIRVGESRFIEMIYKENE